MKPIRLSLLILIAVLTINSSTLAQVHRVRMQIQGDDLKSDISASFNENYIMTKSEGVQMLTELWSKLNDVQKGERSEAFERARDYITNAPVKGLSNQGSRSFQNANRRIGNARIDIEINAGAAFSHDRHIVYIRMAGSDLSSTQSWSYDDRRIVSKRKALEELERLRRNLSGTQQDVRAQAYKDAVEFISRAGVNGYEGSNWVKEFTDSKARNGEKVVITIDKGAAFSD